MAHVEDEVNKAVQVWLDRDRRDKTRDEITALHAAKDYATLQQLLLSPRLEFGTAGLRAAMGAGYCRMNEVTVVQTAQGLSTYLRSQFDAATLSERGVVIGYDGRYNSERFAQLSAATFHHAGIKVRLYRQVVPTPFVPFAIRHFRCCAGVMVTASHNPKDDNGYKVYWDNGAQIISPHDRGIAAAIEDHLDIQPSSYDVAPLSTPGLIVDPYEEISAEYFKSLGAEFITPEVKTLCSQSNVKFVYSAMHGVGCKATTHSLECFGVPAANVVVVKEQADPDPEFPTVVFPNPEEGKAALDLSIKAGDQNNAQIILANDPDADRLAVAEKGPSGWKLLTGNELGALFGWWHWQRYKASGAAVPHDRLCMVSSTVSSRFLKTMSQKEGFRFEETLTGFKWMGSKAAKLQQESIQTLFAFEEAIGFMCGSRVFDKDGVTAAGVMAHMAAHLYGQNTTLTQQLDALYLEYGRHTSNNSYVISRDPAKTKEMFDAIRLPKYPEQVGGVKVTGIRDLTAGYDSATPDNKPVLPVSKSSQMITFSFENGVVLTLRGSGTEPKIKWYSELVEPPGPSTGRSEQVLADLIAAVQKELLRCDHYGFQQRA